MTICNSVKEVPKVKEFRQAASVLYEKRDTAKNDIDAMNRICAQLRGNFSQIQSNTEFPTAQQKARTSLQAFEQQHGTVTGIANPVKEGMQGIGYPACGQEIEQLMSVAFSKQELVDRINLCNMSGTAQERRDIDSKALAQQPANGTPGRSEQDVERMLRNPRSNMALSERMLNEASEYARANGLPDPKAGAGDKICGEACVAVLRAKAADTGTENGASPEYLAARQMAMNTRHGRYNVAYSRYGRVYR